jgi:hypothetical protein
MILWFVKKMVEILRLPEVISSVELAHSSTGLHFPTTIHKINPFEQTNSVQENELTYAPQMRACVVGNLASSGFLFRYLESSLNRGTLEFSQRVACNPSR